MKMFKNYFAYTKFKHIEAKNKQIDYEKEYESNRVTRWRKTLLNLKLDIGDLNDNQLTLEIRKILNTHLFDYEWYSEYQ